MSGVLSHGLHLSPLFGLPGQRVHPPLAPTHDLGLQRSQASALLPLAEDFRGLETTCDQEFFATSATALKGMSGAIAAAPLQVAKGAAGLG